MVTGPDVFGSDAVIFWLALPARKLERNAPGSTRRRTLKGASSVEGDSESASSANFETD
jgi:hypothetical protein